jgi:dethiobiotin synthetase
LTLHYLKSRGIHIIGFVTNGHTEENDEAALSSPGLIGKFSGVPYLGHIPYYVTEEGGPDPFISEKAACLKGVISYLVGSGKEPTVGCV